MTDLGTLGGLESIAYGINASGQVVGESHTRGTTEPRGFLWKDGRMVSLGTLGGSESSAVDISDGGQIVGDSLTADGNLHAFLWQNGTMTDLGTLGGARSQALDINNANQIVGRSERSDGLLYAFLWEDGAMRDLNLLTPLDSGWVMIEAFGINDAGQIVGSGVSPNHAEAHALLLDPLAGDESGL